MIKKKAVMLLLMKPVVAFVLFFLFFAQHSYLYADDTELSQELLTTGLSKAGLSDVMKKTGINIYGYTQAGFMIDTTANKGPTFLGFNNVRHTPMLNKISLNIERLVDPSKKKFDIGFRGEGIWGTDSRFIHSNGMADSQTGRYQWDPLQMYVDVTTPYLPMRIRAGKWIELAGFEHFSANIYGAFGDPMRAFYSYSYQFLYAEPGTQTGVLGTYVLNPKLSVDAGFTRGWNQSVRDTNHRLDFLGRVTYTPTDKTSVIFVMTEGPEYPTAAGRNLPEGDSSHWWTALDLVITHKATDKLSLGVGVDSVNTPRIPSVSEGTKWWGGPAAYISYALNSYFTANMRLEWYNDSSNGYSTGASVGANYYESTLGLAIKPFAKKKYLSRLILRPEVRGDWSNRSVYAHGDKGQLTLSGDVLYAF